MRRVAVALVHFPVLDGAGDVVTTAVTSVDIHDIARSCRTYGVERYYLVHPVTASRELVSVVQRSWAERPETPKNRARREALSRLSVVPSLDAARRDFHSEAELWSTSARAEGQVLSFSAARRALAGEGAPVLVLFGTGNGLAREARHACRFAIEPVHAAAESGYNHLSVRSAVAIILDRLLGERS